MKLSQFQKHRYFTTEEIQLDYILKSSLKDALQQFYVRRALGLKNAYHLILNFHFQQSQNWTVD